MQLLEFYMKDKNSFGKIAAKLWLASKCCKTSYKNKNFQFHKKNCENAEINFSVGQWQWLQISHHFSTQLARTFRYNFFLCVLVIFRKFIVGFP